MAESNTEFPTEDTITYHPNGSFAIHGGLKTWKEVGGKGDSIIVITSRRGPLDAAKAASEKLKAQQASEADSDRD